MDVNCLYQFFFFLKQMPKIMNNCFSCVAFYKEIDYDLLLSSPSTRCDIAEFR